MQIREKDKIEAYIDRLMKENPGCTIITGTKSRYYKIGDKILRVSDHIGANSSGNVSIIVPQYRENSNQYIIHSHTSGKISVLDYEKVKDIVRSFFYMSSIFSDVLASKNADASDEIKEEKGRYGSILKKLSQIENYKMQIKDKSTTILGIPASAFTPGQLQPIMGLVEKKKKEILKVG
jgi:hypothetical protein